MRDIMLDVETTGTSPDRNAMIQVAAVRFDLATGEVDGADTFNECLFMPPWRSWDEETRLWWQKQPAVLQSLLARAKPAVEVMDRFATWAGYDTPVMWAKPITFDFNFVASAFRDAQIPNPFSFRQAMDCRSYLRGLAGHTDYIKETEIEFRGPKHDAIFDVFHQIKWLLANQAKYGQKVLEAAE
jgi:DNA polymerase III alpha subunit (gram-positive type)